MELEEYEFSTFDALKMLKIDRSRLVHWLNGKFIPQGRLVPWGRGYKTVFNIYDIYGIELFKELVDYGLSRKVASKFIGYVNWKEIIKDKKHYMYIHERYKKIDDAIDDNVNAEEMCYFLKDPKELKHKKYQRIGILINLEFILNYIYVQVMHL